MNFHLIYWKNSWESCRSKRRAFKNELNDFFHKKRRTKKKVFDFVNLKKFTKSLRKSSISVNQSFVKKHFLLIFVPINLYFVKKLCGRRKIEIVSNSCSCGQTHIRKRCNVIYYI